MLLRKCQTTHQYKSLLRILSISWFSFFSEESAVFFFLPHWCRTDTTAASATHTMQQHTPNLIWDWVWLRLWEQSSRIPTSHAQVFMLTKWQLKPLTLRPVDSAVVDIHTCSAKDIPAVKIAFCLLNGRCHYCWNKLSQLSPCKSLQQRRLIPFECGHSPLLLSFELVHKLAGTSWATVQWALMVSDWQVWVRVRL